MTRRPEEAFFSYGDIMRVAIIDADLISRRNHRFPNLASMKISAYHKELGDEVCLKLEYDGLDEFDRVYLSKVFTSTEVPESVLTIPNVRYGGTGFFYADAPPLPVEIEHHFPDYHLYDEWVEVQLEKGKTKESLKYYTDYSIGFMTRGCFRKCVFCVNRNSSKVSLASSLSEFYDPARKKICLLDDNFLGSTDWRELLQQLMDTGKPFQFNQGLDERLLTDESCKMLFRSRYDGDYTFAFDNYRESDLIEEKILLARKYTSAVLKFYCFTGYDRTGKHDSEFWKRDLLELLKRIRILMKHGCIPYVMRHENYEKSPYRGMYINIARWCNQPGFYKKKSLREFCEGNGKNSACFRYLAESEKAFPEISTYYDMKYGEELVA